MDDTELGLSNQDDKYYSVIFRNHVIGWEKTPEQAYENALLVIEDIELSGITKDDVYELDHQFWLELVNNFEVPNFIIENGVVKLANENEQGN